VGEPTFMRREIAEIPAATARLLDHGGEAIAAAAQALAARDPALIVTIARGSSDHASAFLKYAIELTAGVPVASIGPSIGSIYNRPLKLERAAAIAISQSGKSPDLVAMSQAARQGGALTIGITNTQGSPLTEVAEHAVLLEAGIERSVAATKTFVSSVVAGLAILAHWQNDRALQRALSELPELFEQAIACDWSPLVPALDGPTSLFVLGRGPTLAIASEAALKFKETCSLHAEAYSAAEVMHGPVAIVQPGFPILTLAARDASEASLVDAADRLAGQGADAFITSAGARSATRLPFASGTHPLTDALALIVSFYAFIEELARHRGLDPDKPHNLNKITETV